MKKILQITLGLLLAFVCHASGIALAIYGQRKGSDPFLLNQFSWRQ